MKKILPFVVLLLTTLPSGCQRSEQTALTPATALEAALGTLHGCLPANLTSEDPGSEDPSHLAIEAVEHEIIEANGRATEQTRVRLVAWSGTNPTTLTLPLYTLSRGRWLLGTGDRVYLVDQECRQYPLLDVQFTSRRAAPGTIRLAPGQAVSGSLIFPPPGPRARLGTLVYGHRTLPVRFPASPASRPASGPQASGR
jgi:hypothetical protein